MAFEADARDSGTSDRFSRERTAASRRLCLRALVESKLVVTRVGARLWR